MSVRYLLQGFQTITPYLTVTAAAKEIEFLVQAFDGVLKFKMENDNGENRHAEVQVGGSRLMIGQAGGRWQPMPMNLYLYLPDCDAVYRSAIAQGAKSLQEPADQFYGHRTSGVEDSQGNKWWIGTPIEDISPEEMAQRMNPITD